MNEDQKKDMLKAGEIVLRAGLNAIPVIGGTIETLIFETAGEIEKENFRRALEAVEDQIRLLI